MNLLTSWAKNIIYYVLFIKILTNLMPNGNMEKYIRLFTGILLIFILIEPLLSFRNIEQNFMNNVLSFEKELYKENFISQSKTYSNVNNQLAIDLYRKKIEENIKKIVNKENMELVFSDIDIVQEEGDDFGSIAGINIKIKKVNKNNNMDIHIENVQINSQKNEEEPMTAENIIIIKNIKTELFNFYNVPINNINISI